MIYIQSDSEKKLAHHFDCSCALYGAIDNAMDYRLTTFEEIINGRFDLLITKNLFVGSTEFMREVFKRAGLNDVRLPANSNRECEIISLKEVYKRIADGNKLFIKPIEIKLFTGFIADAVQCEFLRGFPDDTKVMAYEPFKEIIESEWRIYIHNNKMIDARNYSGDFTVNPDYQYVTAIIESNKTQFPCAYTIDIGVLASAENVVVEYNDMWSIGNYGIPNDIYLRLLKDRYFQIIEGANTGS